MVYTYSSIDEYEKKYGIITKDSIIDNPYLSSEERETFVDTNDFDDNASLTSAQKSVIIYILDKLRNELKDAELEIIDNKIVGINCNLPKKLVKLMKFPT